MSRTILFVCTLFIALHSFGAIARPKPISVPFQIVGSYIIVELSINGSTPLNLILDSGVRNTIITELSAQDSILLKYSETTHLNGLGNGDQLVALSSKGNTMQIGKLDLQNQTVLVLEKDVFNLSKYTGSRIHGLLGSDILQDYVVEINYDRKRLVFYDPKSFVAPKNYSPLYMNMEGQKMFIQIPITEANGKTREVKMLVDTGAELAAWFRAHGNKSLSMPEQKVRGFIGQGLNGEITGYVGRLPEIRFGNSVLKNSIVTFPDSTSIADVSFEGERDGTLGSQILSRFNLIVNVSANLLYMKPNAKFKRPFTYNISGIELFQQNFFLRIPEVMMVWEKSPAQKAGIVKGDQILEVNGHKSYEYDINEIRSILETPSHSVHLLILRGEEQIKVKIPMKSEI
ncbi:MAG: aspartyl protease family protein [Bacteroidales bacterium]|nr:aspartyl protease family protein [Bacteroidales bacterium]